MRYILRLLSIAFAVLVMNVGAASARTHADFSAGHFDPGRMAA